MRLFSKAIHAFMKPLLSMILIQHVGCVLWEEAPPYQPTLTNNTAISTNSSNTSTANSSTSISTSTTSTATQTNTSSSCTENQKVVQNRCVNCPPGRQKPAGDDPLGIDTECIPTLCSENQRVVSNKCEDCPVSTTNMAGDDASGENTSCDPILCDENQRVEANQCVACMPKMVNEAGDDASGVDTMCTPLGFQQISVSRVFGCAVNALGGVECWGNNGRGQLGDNSNIESLMPVDVVGLSKDVIQVSAGVSHACALNSSGGVQCWGFNDEGQLGNNTRIDSPIPVDVLGLSRGVAQITAGNRYTCVVMKTGRAKCWGDNRFGQLGIGTFEPSLTPVDLTQLSDQVTQIKASSTNTCAITKSSAVLCWGRNESGQLGNNSTNDSLLPTEVTGLDQGAEFVDVGDKYACAVMTSGNLKCWGLNSVGQLGNNSTMNSMVPVDVLNLSKNVTSVALGNGFSCAITKAEGVKCWGNNIVGMLGNNSGNRSLVPVDVIGLTMDAKVIANNAFSACAIDSAGTAKCWGDNDNGQLGNGSKENSPIPIPVVRASNK